MNVCMNGCELRSTNYLDLLNFREVSNAIETILGIEHQSPQLLIIENKKCTYFANHNAISATEVLNFVAS